MGAGKRNDVLGAVLAGGAASRMRGLKAGAPLDGRPLVDYPVESLRAGLDEVVVVAKAETELPPLPDGVEVVVEPAEPVHPAGRRGKWFAVSPAA